MLDMPESQSLHRPAHGTKPRRAPYKKGREAIAKADTFASGVDSARAKDREARAVLKAAAELANGVRELIHLLVPELSRGTGWLEVIVDTEPDWPALDETRQERIRSLAILAVAISDLVHSR